MATKKAKPAKKAVKGKKTAVKKTAKKKTAKKATAKKATAKKAAKKPAVKAAATKKKTIELPTSPKLVSPKNSVTKQYTQSELYDCIQEFCGFETRKEAKLYYEGFCNMVQAGLKKGYRLPLPGLGKMQVRKTKARAGINPATREKIQIPAKKRIRFTANKALKDAVL